MEKPELEVMRAWPLSDTNHFHSHCSSWTSDIKPQLSIKEARNYNLTLSPRRKESWPSRAANTLYYNSIAQYSQDSHELYCSKDKARYMHAQ